MDGLLADLVTRHKRGESVAFYSVCSAHPLVLEAAALQAIEVHGLAVAIPEPLISRYLPAQYARVRRGELAPTPKALLVDHVRDVLRIRSRACTPIPGEKPR